MRARHRPAGRLVAAARYLIGLVIGAVQAARGGTRTDTALSIASVTLFAVPGYWLD